MITEIGGKMAEKLKLSDSSIAQIVKLLQLGLLTGTDVADQFRTLELVQVGNRLEPDPEYMEVFEKNLQKLQDEADALSTKKVKPGFAS